MSRAVRGLQFKHSSLVYTKLYVAYVFGRILSFAGFSPSLTSVRRLVGNVVQVDPVSAPTSDVSLSTPVSVRVTAASSYSSVPVVDHRRSLFHFVVEPVSSVVFLA